MTTRQFLQLGEDPPGVHLELVDGEIAVGPSSIPNHSYVVFALASLLSSHITKHDLGQLFGDVDTIFGEYDVRRPDILFFAKHRLHMIGPKAMEGPPDLCVEVLSPSSITIDRRDKYEQYQAGKVANYWLVDPVLRSLDAYKLDRGSYVTAGRGTGADLLRLPPFPDLEIPLAELWRPTV
jgi:Uma2 family endonuclease